MNDKIILLNQLLEVKKDLKKEYQKFIDMSVRVEYSIGETYGPFGYYSSEYLGDFLLGGSRGKLVDSKAKKIDFKYYFDNNNDLILIERFFNGNVSDQIFFYKYNRKKEIYYFNIYDNSIYNYSNKLYLVGVCFYDELNRLMKYIYTDYLINNQVLNYRELKYEYFKDELVIKFCIYSHPNPHTWPDGRIINEEYRYPIKNNKTKKLIKDKEMYNFLKKRVIEIIESWTVENGYAISLIICESSSVSLDYNEENENNVDIHSEKRWNYAFWNQHDYEVTKSYEEKELLQNWLIYLDNKNGEDYSICNLIDNPHFTDMVVKIMNEIRKEGLISKTFGKEVPIIIHDLDYHDHMVKLTKLVNDQYLIDDFIKWYEKLSCIFMKSSS